MVPAPGPERSAEGDGIRLQKVLAQAGLGSRRVCEDLIARRRVTVNGEVAALGRRVDPERDVIEVDGARIGVRPGLVHYLLNKPAGVITTAADTHGRRTVTELVPAEPRVFPVGRLDADTEGLLILTNDGDLAHRLAHPRWGVPRTYRVKVKGFPSDEALERMKKGVRLEDGMARATEVEVEQRTLRNTWLRLVVREGRHHLVKRLCEAVGHRVDRLVRLDYAGVGIEKMSPGELRFLSSGEVRRLRAAVRKEAPPPPGGIRKRARRRDAGAVRDPVRGGPVPKKTRPTAGRPRGRRL